MLGVTVEVLSAQKSLRIFHLPFAGRMCHVLSLLHFVCPPDTDTRILG